MIVLTAEQHRAIEDAGGQPVRVEDPETRATYVLLDAELYERIRACRVGRLESGGILAADLGRDEGRLG